VYDIDIRSKTRRTVTKVTPSQVLERMNSAIGKFAQKNGLGLESIQPANRLLTENTITFHAPPGRDARCVRFTVFESIDGTASQRVTIRVTLHSWFETADRAQHGHRTTTASERSTTQLLYNMAHHVLNEWAEYLGTAR
jgi:hypothetical protein